MLIIVCAVFLITALACSTSASVEHLGQPCRAKNILAGRAVSDPSTNSEWFVLTNTNETTGVELIFIDIEKGTGKAYTAPAGSGSWALKQVSGDRLVVGTYYDGKFMIFDLKKMEFVKTIAFPNESYIWNLAVGNDGRIYGGTYGGGKLGALDLNTYTVEDCGAPAKPNMYLRNVSSTPDGRIFCNFGMEKPVNMIYDPATKQFEPAPKQLEGMAIGVTWNGYFVAGSKVYKGKALDEVAPPFPVPSKDKGQWSVLTELSNEETLYLRQDDTFYRYNKGDKDLTAVVDMDLRGGAFLACSKSGKLLGVRGQDYCVVNPGDKEPVFKPIPVESGPRPVMFLEPDDKGRLWGGPHFGQTLFWMDLKTKKAVNTGKICDAGGEVYEVATRNGKVYAASYAGGDITYYDPELPWDQWNRVNPKPLADVGKRGYIRPVGGIKFGPDGKLYSGWMASYGTYGGALSITDPTTGATELIENPLGEQTVYGVEVDDRFIYIGSSLNANGLPDKPNDSAKLGIIDRSTKQLVFSRTFEGEATVRSLGYNSKTKRLAMIVNWSVRLFDVEKRALLDDLTKDLPRISSISAVLAEGKYYYGSNKSLVAVDMQTGKHVVIAELPEKINCVTIAADGTAYVSCEADIYAVTADK